MHFEASPTPPAPWPCVTARWAPSAPEEITIRLTWRADRLDGAAAVSQESWGRVAAQLADDGIGYFIDATLGIAASPLDAVERAALREFFERVAAAVEAGETLELEGPSFKRATDSALRVDPWFPIEVMLSVERSSVDRWVSPVSATHALDGSTPDYGRLADAIEQSFAGIRVAFDAATDEASALCAVQESLLAVEPQSAAPVVFFAAPPLSTRLSSFSSLVSMFGSADPKFVTDAAVDADVPMRALLETLDDALTPEIFAWSRAAADRPGLIADLLSAKERLILALAARVQPVLAADADAGDVATARAVLAGRLRCRLSSVYEIDVMAQVPFTTRASGRAGALYGPIVDASTGDGLSGTARLLLSADDAPLTLCIERSDPRTTHAELRPAWRITDLELPVIDGAEPARLRLHHAHHVALPGAAPTSEPLRVPLPLRVHPPGLALISHAAVPAIMSQDERPGPSGAADGHPLDAALLWEYCFSFERAAEPHDTVDGIVAYTTTAPAPVADERQADALAAELVRFHHNRYALVQAFDGCRAGTVPAVLACAALEFLAARLTAVVTALELATPAKATTAESGSASRVAFTVVDEGTEARLEPVRTTDGWKTARIRASTDGAIWLRRAVTLGGHSVIDRHSATANLRLRRNAALLPGRATAPAFVYEVSAGFSHPAVPYIDYSDTIDLKAFAGAGASVGDCLHDLLRRFFVGGNSPVLSVQCSCSYVIDAATSLEATIPVLLVPRATFTSADDLAEPLASTISRFLQVNTLPAGAMLMFALSLYASDDADRPPLLRLESLRLPASTPAAAPLRPLSG